MFDQLLKRYSPFINLYNCGSIAFQHSDNNPSYSAGENVDDSITMNEIEEEDFMVVDKMLVSEKVAISTEKPAVSATICSPLVGSNSNNDVSVLDDIEEDFMVVDKPQTENLVKTAINSAPDALLSNCNFNGNCSIIDEIEEDFFIVAEQETQSAKSAKSDLSVNHSVGANVTAAITRSDSNEFVMVEQIDYNPFAGNTDSGRILDELERYFMTIDNPMNYVDPNSRLTKPVATEIGTSDIFIDKSATAPAIRLVDRLGNFATPFIWFNPLCTIATVNSCLANYLVFSTAAPLVDDAFVLVNEASNSAALSTTLVKYISKFAVSPSYLVGRLRSFTTANATRCVSKKSAAVSHSNLVLKSFHTFAAARNSMVKSLYKIASTPTHLVNCAGAAIANIKVNATRKSAVISSSGSMTKSLHKISAARTSMANGFYTIATTPVRLVKRLGFSTHASTHVYAPVHTGVNAARHAPKKSPTILGSASITKFLRKITATHTSMVNCLYTIAITPGYLVLCIGINIANVNGNAYRQSPTVSHSSPMTKTLHKIAAAHTSMVNCLYTIAITPGHLVHCVGVNIANVNGNAHRRYPSIFTAGTMTKTVHTFASGRTFMANGLYKIVATPAHLLNRVGATISISKKNTAKR